MRDMHVTLILLFFKMALVARILALLQLGGVVGQRVIECPLPPPGRTCVEAEFGHQDSCTIYDDSCAEDVCNLDHCQYITGESEDCRGWFCSSRPVPTPIVPTGPPG